MKARAAEPGYGWIADAGCFSSGTQGVYRIAPVASHTGLSSDKKGMVLSITRVALLAVVGALASAGASPASELSRDSWSPGSSSIQEPEIVPPAFRGRWAPSAGACADVDGVDSLTIFANGVDYYESGGRLEQVTQAGQARAVRLRIAYEGEGKLWRQEEVWTLSPDGARLTIATADESPTTAIRCD